MSAMLLKMNGHASILSRTKHIEFRYFFIQDKIEKGYIGYEYCYTNNMVAYFITKTLQVINYFEFSNRITVIPYGKNNAEVQKKRYEIQQNEDFQNGQAARRLKSKQFKQESNRFLSSF